MKQTRSGFTLLSALLAVAAASALPAAAQTLRPGLWETSSIISSSDPQTKAAMSQLQKHLAGMSASQQESVQQMLKHNGVQANLGPNGTLRTRACLTREMIDRKELPVQQGDCTQKATQVSPTQVKVAFTCTKPAVSGEGNVVVDNDTHYHAHVVANGGKGQNAEADVNGAWLAADCGDLRPVPVPQTK